MRIDILTLFPDMFSSMEHSIIGKAKRQGLIDLYLHNFRDFAKNKQKHADDYPYGGETAGMLLLAQPIFDAVDAIEKETLDLKKRIVLLDPAGKVFDQKMAKKLAAEKQLIFICGHYEGVDERVRSLVTDEISLGDYVLTGGELGAMVITDSVLRLLPGVLGNDQSVKTDSHSSGLLEEPQYTRPRKFCGLEVPDILLSGNHEKIRQWRLKESLRRTHQRRPEMLENFDFTDEMKKMFSEVLAEELLKSIHYPLK
ncbi:MAG: tRNA (guanosine(37)-N1)-methyltransferase TrmD [Lactobacillales bacterium]|jgi:tRNA (guanine37-N1)-methyltransferase|nr:tRNA (guanosine(37)-N1)-methyltransferase TrmD [Lactobacillales bacterium]